jgi:hypothetical protein
VLVELFRCVFVTQEFESLARFSTITMQPFNVLELDNVVFGVCILLIRVCTCKCATCSLHERQNVNTYGCLSVHSLVSSRKLGTDFNGDEPLEERM